MNNTKKIKTMYALLIILTVGHAGVHGLEDNDCSTCIKIKEKNPKRILGINIDLDSDVLTSDPECGNMGSCSYNSAPGKCVVYKGDGTVNHKRVIGGDGSSTGELVFRVCEEVNKDETGRCTPYSLKNGQEANYRHILQELKKLKLLTRIESITFNGNRCVENHASLLIIDIFNTLCLISIALSVTF